MSKKYTSVLFGGLLTISGCTPTVKIEAPDKPITVNLNVNVEHKLKVQIDKDMDQVMKSNPDLF